MIFLIAHTPMPHTLRAQTARVAQTQSRTQEISEESLSDIAAVTDALLDGVGGGSSHNSLADGINKAVLVQVVAN